MENLIDAKVTDVFLRNWRVAPGMRWVVNRGATRSSKTTSLAQQAVVWLVTGQYREQVRIERGSMAVVRKVGATLTKTVMRDFESVLTDWGLWALVKVNKTERIYRCGPRWVEFVGADDEQKMRGFKATITWMNEGNELEWDKEVMQLRFRTERYLVVDFNPSDPYVWINEKLEMSRAQRKGDVEVIVSTYRDNPYLSVEQIAEIEDTQHEDLDYWQVYGLGQYGKVRGLVFPNVTVVDAMPAGLKHRGFGMDFGNRNGVTTLIECGLMNERDVYLDQWFYQRGMSPADISATMRQMGVGKLPVAADPAGEWTIEHLMAEGWNVFGAQKGPDSVAYGIDLLNQYNLHVTARSVDVLRERLKYRFKVDSNGTVLSVPVDAFNHSWDSARYWAITYLKPRRRRSALLEPREKAA